MFVVLYGIVLFNHDRAPMVRPITMSNKSNLNVYSCFAFGQLRNCAI